MEYEAAYFFGGGGCGGFVYPGVIQAIEILGLPTKNISVNGESVGALMGAALALGYTSKEIRKFLEKDKILEKLLIPSFEKIVLSIIHKEPWFEDHSKLERVIEPFYGKNIKLKDVPNLTIFTADANSYKRIIMNAENYPETPLNEALIASASIPILFKPYQGMVDGGLAKGSGIEEFLQKNSADQIISMDLMGHPVNKILNYIMSTLGYFKENHNETRREKSEYVKMNYEEQNILHVDFNISPSRFLDTGKKNREYLRRLGKNRITEAYNAFMSKKEVLAA